MPRSIESQRALWDQFLSEWPLERLRYLSLDEYCSFSSAIETETKDLGSNVGHTQFKYGIYRQAQPKDGATKQHIYSGQYAWESKYGKDRDDAFHNILNHVVSVATLASQGKYVEIDDVPLYPLYKWKLAFLYQDKENIGVLNIFSERVLRHLARKLITEMPNKNKHFALHKALLDHHLGTTQPDILTLGDHLWRMWKNNEDPVRSWLIPLDGVDEPEEFAKKKILPLSNIPAWVEYGDDLEISDHDWLVLSSGNTIVSWGKINTLEDPLTWNPKAVRRPLPGRRSKKIVPLGEDGISVVWPRIGAGKLQPIKSINVKYFRSIKELTIEHCAQMNVISGSNDVGKSNILRALHLFFNDEADWQRPLVFNRDFNVSRAKDPKKVKKLIEITVTFNIPGSMWKSLPHEVSVTRMWDIDGNMREKNSLETQWKKKQIPGAMLAARRSLSQFFNSLLFEYVPAVKDRTYFEHLLEKLQMGVLSKSLEGSELANSGKRLAEHIQSKIPDLQAEFKDATGLDTLIAAPLDYIDYFQTFKVHTLVESEKTDEVPLISRGDGMQARYVASVLHQVAKNNPKKNIIWGFEEPENSLELKHADNLAKDFLKHYTQSAQIFVTSHNPAFLALNDKEECQLFRAYQKEHQTQLATVTELDDLHNELGILRIHQELHQLYLERMTALNDAKKAREEAEERAKAAEAELERKNLPLIFTEGSTDKMILDTAWAKLYPSKQCPFLVAIGKEKGWNAQSVSNVLKVGSTHNERIVIGIFDHDGEGLNKISSLGKSFIEIDGNRDGFRMVKAESLNIFALSLPVPTNYCQNPEYAKNLFMELLFPQEVQEVTNQDGRALVIKNNRSFKHSLHGSGPQEYSLENDPEMFEIAIKHGWVGKKAENKTEFARDIVPTLEPAMFEAFRPLFEAIEKIIGEHS